MQPVWWRQGWRGLQGKWGGCESITGLLLAGGYKKAEIEIQALTEVPVWGKKEHAQKKYYWEARVINTKFKLKMPSTGLCGGVCWHGRNPARGHWEGLLDV